MIEQLIELTVHDDMVLLGTMDESLRRRRPVQYGTTAVGPRPSIVLMIDERVYSILRCLMTSRSRSSSWQTAVVGTVIIKRLTDRVTDKSQMELRLVVDLFTHRLTTIDSVQHYTSRHYSLLSVRLNQARPITSLNRLIRDRVDRSLTVGPMRDLGTPEWLAPRPARQ